MRKSIILLLSFLFLNIANWEDSRNCETLYSKINWVNYFWWLYCSEDIKLTWVVAETLPLKWVSPRIVNDFLILNNHRIVEHIEGWTWSLSCDGFDTIPDLQSFENEIYEKNEISYTTATSDIETLTTEIEWLIEESNSKDLYWETSDEVKEKFPISSNDFLVNATKDTYFDKLDELKEGALSKQKEKLTLIYKLTETQKIIWDFYDRVNKICQNYIEGKEKETPKETPKETLSDKLSKKFIINEDDGKTEEEIKQEKIDKYKAEFNVKLWSKLDSLPRQTLQRLSVKLIWYPYTSKIFLRSSESQKAIVILKIAGLKAAIDDRLK